MLLLVACGSPEYNEIIPQREFRIYNRGGSGYNGAIYCDSVRMVTPFQAKFWVDGQENEIFSEKPIVVSSLSSL